MSEQCGMSSAGRWKRSSTCSNGQCVELAVTSRAVHLRDSRNGQNYITFNRSDWVGFVAEAQGHSRAAETSAIRVSGGSDDVEVACRDSDESLTFSRCDWDIFLEGVRAGEFDL